MKKLLLSLLLLMCISLTACSTSGVDSKFNQLDKPSKGEEIAIVKTSMGDIKIRFFSQYAKKSVENFTVHSKKGYYNNLTFHRIINDFMIQGGDPLGNGTGGESIWGKPFEDEININLHNYRGALSMANSGPNTNGSQFFIVQSKIFDEATLEEKKNLDPKYFEDDVIEKYKKIGGTPHLDGKHTVFGQVFEGMDIVDKIAAVKTSEEGVPEKPVKIIKIDIVKYND